MLFNIVNLVMSSMALAATSLLAFRQARLMRQGNHMPVLLEFFKESGTSEFLNKERRACMEASTVSDTQGGFASLPEFIRDDAYDVCMFYQRLAYLVAWGMIDRELAIVFSHYRVTTTWHAMKRFVEAERRRRGSEYSFLNQLEEFVEMVEAQQPSDIHSAMRRRNRRMHRL
ncbi:hypothetical protein OH805_18900 [Streptomyces sp. NBC_00879]|uniref:DUF4760 domain-containing protein n=1 Tax=Streptomyces sp. NBC_00879 TaxID=2975855 RepID=UPI00386BF548|nr:hypothetical protein OH805_18900 [Streptomyces sp. NBC_00879]